MNIGRLCSLLAISLALSACALTTPDSTGPEPTKATQCREIHRQMAMTQNGINRTDTAWERNNRATQLQRSYDNDNCDNLHDTPATPQSAPSTPRAIDSQ